MRFHSLFRLVPHAQPSPAQFNSLALASHSHASQKTLNFSIHDFSSIYNIEHEVTLFVNARHCAARFSKLHSLLSHPTPICVASGLTGMAAACDHEMQEELASRAAHRLMSQISREAHVRGSFGIRCKLTGAELPSFIC